MLLDESAKGVLGAFDWACRQSGLSVGTRSVYRSALASWLGYGGALGHLDVVLLGRYLRDRRARLSTATVNGDLKVLRRFYAWSAAGGHCAPGTDQQVPRGTWAPSRLPRTYTIDQIADVLTAPDPSTWLGFRDTVLLRLLCDTGLKTSQVAQLAVGDVLDDGMLHIAKVRGRPARYVPLSLDLQGLLGSYIERRREVRPGKRSALFLTHTGHALAERTICQLTSRHIRRALGRALGCCMARITGRPWQGHYPHALRATLAQHYLDRGLDVVRVAQLLGYADASSAQRHAGVDLGHLRAAISKHPRRPGP